MGSAGYGRASDREGLIRAYDEEENTGFGLTDLAEDSDDDDTLPCANGRLNGKAKTNGNGNGNGNGHKRTFSEPVERARKTPPRSPRLQD